jgi:hypothetical protein
MHNDVVEKSERKLEELCRDPSLSKYLDPSLRIPKPYVGKGSIKLIVLGQDPTVKDAIARKSINMVLNLDKKKSVWNYLVKICRGIGIDMSENVYATNLFKNFFSLPPTQIEEIDIFATFLPHWLPILKEELAQYPNLPIITLGEPVLQTILNPGMPTRLREYWGYTTEWKNGKLEPFQFIQPAENILGRTVFPFPHQPSIRKEFYKQRMDAYIAFMKKLTFPILFKDTSN